MAKTAAERCKLEKKALNNDAVLVLGFCFALLMGLSLIWLRFLFSVAELGLDVLLTDNNGLEVPLYQV